MFNLNRTFHLDTFITSRNCVYWFENFFLHSLFLRTFLPFLELYIAIHLIFILQSTWTWTCILMVQNYYFFSISFFILLYRFLILKVTAVLTHHGTLSCLL
uniref:Ovule protein n=1 Tax=Heterorhabditis bacteriophora TaxID=37862 RepID=A0A1I7WCD7_HETBA